MKRQYTEMVTSLRRAHKLTGLSYDRLCDEALKVARSSGTNAALQEAFIGIETLYETGSQTCHIFMPNKAFCTWLTECAQTLDPELAERAAEGFGSSLVCLHFSTEANLPSVLVKIGTGNVKGEVVIDFSMSSPLGGAVVNTKLNGQRRNEEMTMRYDPGDDVPYTTRKAQADMGEFYTRMIAGLGLYMGAFPEQVRDGIPEDAKRFGCISGPVRTIGVSEKVVVREGVTPHYRVGHFRLLSAERFTNKRGQVVFVHGCFVKGPAKTVLGIEEARM